MGSSIRPQNITVTSKDGEITVTLVLELNINLNNITAIQPDMSEPETQDTLWEVPNFKNPTKIKFGKTIEEGKV